jgi:hypothetical protein
MSISKQKQGHKLRIRPAMISDIRMTPFEDLPRMAIAQMDQQESKRMKSHSISDDKVIRPQTTTSRQRKTGTHRLNPRLPKTNKSLALARHSSSTPSARMNSKLWRMIWPLFVPW